MIQEGSRIERKDRQGGRRRVTRQRSVPNPQRPLLQAVALPPSGGWNWPELFLISLHLAPHPASLFILLCPEFLYLASLSPLSNPLLHRLQVATSSCWDCCLVNSQRKPRTPSQHSFPLYPWASLLQAVWYFSGRSWDDSHWIAHLFPLVPVLPLRREEKSGS